MTVSRLLVQVTAVFLALAIIGGGYIGYRLWGVSKAKSINLRDDFSSIPPVICTSRSSDFNGYDTATTSIANGRARIVSYSKSPQGSGILNVLVDAQKNFYIWSEGSKRGLTFNSSDYSAEVSSEELGALNLASRAFVFSECEPWWSPNDATFSLPLDVEFGQTL